MLIFARAVTGLNRFLFALTKWAIYGIALLMLYEVVSRYSLEHPTSWAPELATLTFGPFFRLGGPYLLHLGGHVAVDILSARAQGRLRLVLELVGMILAFIFGAILLRYSVPLVLQSYEYNETSYSAWNPVIWPTKGFLPLAAALLALQALAEIIFTLTGKRSPAQTAEAAPAEPVETTVTAGEGN
jgi:TRAP-type C4-dicarboxylate transport system permease small subunit